MGRGMGRDRPGSCPTFATPREGEADLFTQRSRAVRLRHARPSPGCVPYKGRAALRPTPSRAAISL